MTDKMKSFVKGILLFLGGHPLPQGEKEPVAYLYNGVRLPKLPQVDDAEYPYALIAWNNYNSKYLFVCSKYKPFYTTRGPYGTSTNSPGIGTPSAMKYVLEDNAWSSPSTIGGINLSEGYCTLIWANFDVLDDDGSAYMKTGTTTDPYAPPTPADPVLPIPTGATHCLYNGKKFAVLTEWNIAVYPYVFLCETLWGSTDEVIASRRPVLYGEQPGGKIHINNHYEHDTDSWGPWGNHGHSGSSNTSQIWANYDVYDSDGVLKLKASDPEPVTYLDFSSAEPFSIATFNATKNWDGTLYYSVDANTWNEWKGTDAIASAGDDGNHHIYLRGSGNSKITGSDSNAKNQRWVLTGSNIYCSGNIENLLDYETVLRGEHPHMAVYAFMQMFRSCANLITPPDLPATTLTAYCYMRMFTQCSGLTTTPKLPATILANSCYYDMFSQCSSLETLPELPAATLADSCYRGMFHACTNIKLSTDEDSTYQTAFRIPSSGNGVVGTDSLLSMFADTGGSFTGAPEINKTYYTSNEVV